MEDMKDLPIDRLDLSVRSYNCLMRSGIRTVGALLNTDADTLYGIRNMGKQSVEEVLQKINEYRTFQQSDRRETSPAESTPDLASWIETEEGKLAVCEHLARQRHMIDELELLSARSYNILSMCGHSELHKILFLSEEELLELPNMTAVCAREIAMVCERYRKEHTSDFTDAYTSAKVQSLSMEELLQNPAFHDSILRFAKFNDCSLDALNLTAGALKRLSEKGYRMRSDILFLTESDLLQFPGMGKTIAQRILSKVREYLAKNSTRIRSFLSGDENAFITDAEIRARILHLYDSNPFDGLHYPEIKEGLSLPSFVSDERLKHIIGDLLAEGKLEYVDFCCYRIYPCITDYLENCEAIKDREKHFLKKRLDGQTLEEIGGEYGLTRERVRQVIKKSIDKLREQCAAETGLPVFDEDYYRYLYKTYTFDKKDASEWLGIPMAAFRYFDLIDLRPGKDSLDGAPDNKQLEAGLRLKIRNYLNRNKVHLRGRWVEKKRAVLEPIALEHCGQSSIAFDDFCVYYNRFLKENGIPYDEDIYYTDSVKATRKNHLADAHFVLWKQNAMLRYYDIDGRDYTELFDGLRLAEYENVEFSTAKWFKEHPVLMDRYDIRDHYELHNLLRKTVKAGSFHNIEIKSMPNVLFGTFDRDAAIMQILRDHAPVTADDLSALVSEEYGFDPAVVRANYLKPFYTYYYQGIYRIDQKPMAEDHMNSLLQVLTENFYYVGEIRTAYLRLFPDGDMEEINPFNLKRMGFQFFSNYALKGHESLDSYFRHLLTESDMIDITAYKRRFTYVQAFYAVYMDLRRSLTVIEYEPNRILSVRKLESAGITRKDLQAFCNEVFDYAPDHAYFNICSLKQDGFSSALFDLGFSDWFYANLLLSDDRFSFGTAYGAYVFRKDRKQPLVRDFLEERVNSHRSIALYDLMNELADRYGCRIGDRYDIETKLYGSVVFHDRFTDRLYPNEDAYEREVEETEVRYL